MNSTPAALLPSTKCPSKPLGGGSPIMYCSALPDLRSEKNSRPDDVAAVVKRGINGGKAVKLKHEII